MTLKYAIAPRLLFVTCCSASKLAIGSDKMVDERDERERNGIFLKFQNLIYWSLA